MNVSQDAVTNRDPIPFSIGDVVRLKKPHPCGGFDWTVTRLGADIGIKCLLCGRRVLLPRRELERRLKRFVSRAVIDASEETARVEVLDSPVDLSEPVD
ncbi:MAG: DUF951 domain-containing protein [Thermomicrobiales bacterium]